MKIDLFVLPSVMRADFSDAFVLSKDELCTLYPAFIENLEMAGADFDEWYAETYLWDKMSPDLPRVRFEQALASLRAREGTVLFMSESEASCKPCSLIYHGRPLTGFVAMADPRELADRIEYEWLESARLLEEENRFMENSILPPDLYVFDTTLDWVIVFTHETDSAPDGAEGGAKSRFCLSFGCE